MTGSLYKHRRLILTFIIIFIGIPFIFFIPGVSWTSILGMDQNQYPLAVAQAGDIPILTQDFLRQYDAVASSRADQNGVQPPAQELVNDGTVEQILDSLIANALITAEVKKRGMTAKRQFLEEELRKLPDFQNEAGEFDPVAYNEFVQNAQAQGIDWNSIYEFVNDRLQQRLFGNLILASARTLESEIREQFVENHTQIVVKYAAIEPKVELSEDAIRQHYADHQANYMWPEERVAQVAVISLDPGIPESAYDVLARANSEDFETLAKEVSQGPDAATGGDMGWIVETPNLPEYQKVLFNLAVGAISDIVQGPTGLHIFKVEEERTSEVSGARDVRARQIILRPTLAPEERQSRLDRAKRIADAAKATGDLAAAAKAEGIEVKETSPFTIDSVEIENIDAADAIRFRRDLSTVMAGTVTDPIEAPRNVYVAMVSRYTEPRQKTFDEAREAVEKDAIALYKNGPEYVNKVREYVEKIKAEAKTLEDIRAIYPDLELEIKQTEPFKKNDFLFQQQIFWQPTEVFAALEGAEPGTVAGPVQDFQRVNHFVELVSRTVPDEQEIGAAWDEEQKQLRDTALNIARFERHADYVQFLRERAVSKFLVRTDNEAVRKVLGLDREQGTSPTEQAPVTPVVELDAPDTESGAAPAISVISEPAPDATTELAGEEPAPVEEPPATPESDPAPEETAPEPPSR